MLYGALMIAKNIGKHKNKVFNISILISFYFFSTLQREYNHYKGLIISNISLHY